MAWKAGQKVTKAPKPAKKPAPPVPVFESWLDWFLKLFGL